MSTHTDTEARAAIVLDMIRETLPQWAPVEPTGPTIVFSHISGECRYPLLSFLTEGTNADRWFNYDEADYDAIAEMADRLDAFGCYAEHSYGRVHIYFGE